MSHFSQRIDRQTCIDTLYVIFTDLYLVEHTHGDAESFRESCLKIHERPFHQTTVSIYRLTSQEHILVMKGDAGQTLERCSTIRINGQIEQLTGQRRRAVKERGEEIIKRGEKVIAFAQLSLTDTNFELKHLEFCGFIGVRRTLQKLTEEDRNNLRHMRKRPDVRKDLEIFRVLSDMWRGGVRAELESLRQNGDMSFLTRYIRSKLPL